MDKKRCVKCKKYRLIIEFFKNVNYEDGYHTVCKLCMRENYINSINKITCKCGRVINEKYLEKHKETNLHKNYLKYSSEFIKSIR
jgi:hypothetical protein